MIFINPCQQAGKINDLIVLKLSPLLNNDYISKKISEIKIGTSECKGFYDLITSLYYDEKKPWKFDIFFQAAKHAIEEIEGNIRICENEKGGHLFKIFLNFRDAICEVMTIFHNELKEADECLMPIIFNNFIEKQKND